MPQFVGIGEVGRHFGVPPHLITNLFYKGHLDGDRCPVVSGRRLVPRNYFPEVERVLVERGLICSKREVPSHG